VSLYVRNHLPHLLNQLMVGISPEQAYNSKIPPKSPEPATSSAQVYFP
jgi:hypothetical protein